MGKSVQQKHVLGIEAKDQITGFTGTLTAFCSYITGCDQYLIAPPVDTDGKHVDAKWYDVNRIEILSKKPIQLDTSKDQGPCESAPVK